MNIDVSSFTNRRAVNRHERISVGDVFERITWSFPNKEAIVAWDGAFADPENQRITYKQADEKANKFANALLAQGLKRGDRVLFFCINSTEFFLAQVGAAKAGMVAVPVNIMMAPDLLSYVIQQVEPSFTIVDAELYPNAEKVFKENKLPVGVTIPIGGKVVDGSVSFNDFISASPVTEPDIEIHGDDIFQILFTAGTTAMPKGVMQSHIYMYFCAIGHAMTHTRGILTETDYIKGVFYPMFHIAAQGMTYSALFVGGTAVITRKPDAELMPEILSKEKITATFGSPHDFMRLADIIGENPEKYDTSFLKVISIGWGVFRPDYDLKLREIFGQDLVLIGYDGQTECVYDNRMWHHKWYEKYKKSAPRTNYLGVSHPFYATTVMDMEGNICPPGVVGEKVMRSPVMMAAYYKNEEATREAFKYGWLHGGDAAEYDDENLLIMVDRYKDIIKSGGENVSSVRVEQQLMLHPQVELAAVVGLKHEKWQEAVTGFVVLKKDSQNQPDEAELIAFCKESLGGYEVPKKIIFISEIPQTVGGKMQKYILRDKYAEIYTS